MTTLTRVGTHQTQSFVMDQVNKSTSRFVDLQEQVSTGQKTQRFDGMPDDAAMTVNLANTENVLKQYLKASDTTDARLAAGHNALSNVLDILSKFRAQLLQAMTAEQADDGQINRVADGYLGEVEAALNTDLGGVYIFGGTKNDRPPVDLTNPVDNANGTYYSGADTLMQARIDENNVLSFGTTADRQGFKDFISGLQRVSSASSSLDQLKTALDSINSALSDLTQLEAEYGHQMNVVERSKTRNSGVQATLTNQLSTLRDVDVSAAVVEMTQRQTILQASYMVISKAADLTLTNYLR